MTLYLDTSAAAKLLVEEAESQALAAWLDASDEQIVSSTLLETEMRRVAVRLDLSQALVSDLLDRISLVNPVRSLFHEAGLLPGPQLRSLDALHLATALRLRATVVAYDVRLLESARALGLAVQRPGSH